MKFSEDPEKSTVPGKKAVYRLLDSEVDFLFKTLRCYPLGQEAHLAVTPTQVTCLRQEGFAKGQITQPLCSDAECREKVQRSIQNLAPDTEITGPQTLHCGHV
ncbi:unnamed protein product [Arctogadus glacialis]